MCKLCDDDAKYGHLGEAMTDENIKPVAWYDDDLEIHYGPTQPVFTITGWKPLYPESALAQAEEKGRLAGLREAAEKCKYLVEAAEEARGAMLYRDNFSEAAPRLTEALAALNKDQS